mgnify:CR=1 FL=1
MHWSDEAIVLSARPHGETSAIVELLTRERGRHLGLVKGGRSRRLRPVLQPGNIVKADWRARLSEHLGNFTVEVLESHAARVIDDRAALAGLDTLTALARLLPERDPHEGLYKAATLVVRTFSEGDLWPALLVRWELALLDDLGFGLDLKKCASTGQTRELVYVSPKSGKAVSREAGEPYSDKLFDLPEFLHSGMADDKVVNKGDVANGFRLTTHFFQRHVWKPRGLKPPQSRARLIAILDARDNGTGTQ